MSNLDIVVFDKNGKNVTKERKWFVDIHGDLYYVKNNICDSQSMNIDMEGNICFEKNEQQTSSTLGNLVRVNTNEYTYRMEIMVNL